MFWLIFLVAFVEGKSWVPEMENAALYEGDIVLRPGEKPKNAYGSIIGKRWREGQVPYEMGSFPTKEHSKIHDAIKQYHDHTCVRFVPKKSHHKEYISFYSGMGCHSPVGYRRGEVNYISIGLGCRNVGTIMHEIAHSLGLYHEQSRPDRDDYVSIMWKNVRPDRVNNFKKQTNVDSLNTAYDYRSLMHYSGTAFAIKKDLITIKTKDSNAQGLIGNRKGFSGNDIVQLRKMYPHCLSTKPKKCGDGSADGKRCGCHKGFCWSKCKLGWCYTNGEFGRGSLNGNFVACTKDDQCEQYMSCGGACTLF